MEDPVKKTHYKVVYSCSGCSSSAQMANWIALQLDRAGFAEMSCIAGVGGGVGPLVQKARSAGYIIGVDGCPLVCVKHCLDKEGLKPDIHYDLKDFGAEKKIHEDFDREQARRILSQILTDLDSRRDPRNK